MNICLNKKHKNYNANCKKCSQWGMNKNLGHKEYANKISIRYGEVREGFMEQGPHQINLKRFEQGHMTVGKVKLCSFC